MGWLDSTMIAAALGKARPAVRLLRSPDKIQADPLYPSGLPASEVNRARRAVYKWTGASDLLSSEWTGAGDLLSSLPAQTQGGPGGQRGGAFQVSNDPAPATVALEPTQHDRRERKIDLE